MEQRYTVTMDVTIDDSRIPDVVTATVKKSDEGYIAKVIKEQLEDTFANTPFGFWLNGKVTTIVVRRSA